jgi:DNA-binding MarR family transcriptional regulator
MRRKTDTAAGSQGIPDIDCACAGVRRAARLVTMLYGEEMGARVEPSQFMLLSVMSERPGSPQASLGRAFGFDKTTLSRNLSLMKKNGWIELVEAEDRRDRGYRLTAIGEQLLADTKPGWKRAQEKLRAAMSREDWDNMIQVFGHVARAAQQARTKEEIAE